MLGCLAIRHRNSAEDRKYSISLALDLRWLMVTFSWSEEALGIGRARRRGPVSWLRRGTSRRRPTFPTGRKNRAVCLGCQAAIKFRTLHLPEFPRRVFMLLAQSLHHAKATTKPCARCEPSFRATPQSASHHSRPFTVRWTVGFC